jgi:serine/threonine protein kinase
MEGRRSAKVVDFGITKGEDVRHDITATGMLIGTSAYMAPECFSGRFEYRSDLYSPGYVRYEMVTGHRPFGGTSWHLVHQHLYEQPARLRSLRPRAARATRPAPAVRAPWRPGRGPRRPGRAGAGGGCGAG